MLRYKLVFTFIVINLTVLAANENKTLKEYLDNKINISKLKIFAENSSVDSALVYASEIFKSNDKTFYVKANVLLSDMFFNLRYSDSRQFDLSLYGMQKRNLFINKKKELSFYYLDKAVECGLCWNCIDEDRKEFYDNNRYKINRDLYIAKYANVELINLIREIEVTDQGNRRGPIDQRKMELDDSINCDKLTNWIKISGWPSFLSISIENSICWTNEHSSLMTFTRHYDRENLLFFIDVAYQSAIKGLSTWNQVFELEISKFNRFAEQFVSISKDKTAYISPLLLTYTDSIKGSLNLEESMFEILSVAEISQNYQIALFPTRQFYKSDPQNAYHQLMNFYNTLEQLGSSVKPTDFTKISYFNPLTYKNYFINSDNFSSFIIVLISDRNEHTSWTVPLGFPTIIENSNLSENDINSIFKDK